MPYVYPTNFAMQKILPDLMARGRQGRLGLDIFPTQEYPAASVRWTQDDNYYGLQQMRGLDGGPAHVQRVGFKQYAYEPGYYGEFVQIGEQELITRAGTAPIDTTPIDIEDLIVNADAQLIGRELDRMEKLVWDVLVSGSVTIEYKGPGGLNPNKYTDTYTIQTYTASVPWATTATATPIANFQSVQQLQVGHSVDLGAGAMAYMNQKTLNYLLNNSNSADFGGRRNQYGATLNNIDAVANYWQAQNLPKPVVYDQGYYPLIGQTTTAQFSKFIPDNKVVVVGARPQNARVGEIQLTRNGMNPNFAPGPYRLLKDYAQGVNAPKEIPPRIEIHRGWNGGPAIFFPSAVVVMSV